MLPEKKNGGVFYFLLGRREVLQAGDIKTGVGYEHGGDLGGSHLAEEEEAFLELEVEAGELGDGVLVFLGDGLNGTLDIVDGRRMWSAIGTGVGGAALAEEAVQAAVKTSMFLGA